MKRGPKSQAELTVVKADFGPRRPEPPANLAPHEAVIWREVVDSEPVDFFATAALRGILADYCRHRASADQVSEALGSFKPAWLKLDDGAKRYKLLLQMRELSTRAALSTATKLRLTNQSRYLPRGAEAAGRHAARGPRPWEE
jgi:hypothetical protein